MFVPCTSFFFFFKQKTAYEMRISDWSSDVCSSDLLLAQKDVLRQRIQKPVTVEVDEQGAATTAGDLPVPDPDVPLDEASGEAASPAAKIGRASCRERVCQYV